MSVTQRNLCVVVNEAGRGFMLSDHIVVESLSEEACHAHRPGVEVTVRGRHGHRQLGSFLCGCQSHGMRPITVPNTAWLDGIRALS